MKSHEMVEALESIGFEFTLHTYISEVGIAVAVIEAGWNGLFARSDESFVEEIPDCTAMSIQAASRLLKNWVLDNNG